MKKLYFVLIMTCVSGIKAQFTLTSSMNPIVGDIENSWKIDTTNLSLGSPGTAQIWNYTNISISPSTAVTSNSYVSPSSAPNSASFPGAVNLAQTSDGVGYSMAGYTSSGITIYGYSTPSVTAIYQNPEVLLNYPFSYGMISTDTYSTSYTYSSTSVVTVGSTTTTADGMGTLNTPGNSFPNVLRIKLQDKSVTTYNSTYTTTNTAVNYVYLSSISKFSLLGINTSTTSVSSTSVITKSKSGSVNNMVLAGIKENKSGMNFSMYPNPAINKEVVLHFALTNTENYVITVYNVLGQEVKKTGLGEKTPGVYNETISLSDLQNGIYYIRLKGNKQEGVQKLVIE